MNMCVASISKRLWYDALSPSHGLHGACMMPTAATRSTKALNSYIFRYMAHNNIEIFTLDSSISLLINKHRHATEDIFFGQSPQQRRADYSRKPLYCESGPIFGSFAWKRIRQVNLVLYSFWRVFKTAKAMIWASWYFRMFLILNRYILNNS